MTRGSFSNLLPHVYYLDATDLEGLTSFLHDRGWLGPNESILDVVQAGDGNMNCTVRVTTTATSFILKQSRPWVEKYPDIPAPFERTLREGEFYQLVADHDGLSSMMPKLLGFDRQAVMLQLEDLGSAVDYTCLYGLQDLEFTDFEKLLSYLSILHREFLGFPEKNYFANRTMRKLNHEHVFRLPLAKNNLNLDGITTGLQLCADVLKADVTYVAEVNRLGERYLEEGRALLHGDYFPGSWMKVNDEVRVIDPEFCFFGPPEFDVGVMIAHLQLTQQPDGLMDRLFDVYEADDLFDRNLAVRFAGVEVMRRLIGVAQLPLFVSLDRKQTWLDWSRQLVCEGYPKEGL